LRILEEGDPRGHPVFFLHGSPGSRLLFPGQVQEARRKSIRLIGHDRPGYGGSTPKPGRTVADEAADVSAIADALGIDRFAVYGHSGGGAPTLACAALLPKRVVAAASLAGVAPYPAEGLDWTAGMGELNVSDFHLMLSDRPAWEAKSAEDAAMLQQATPDGLIDYMSSLVSDVDRTFLTEEMASFLLRQGREGLRPGIAGAVDDALSGVQPWGFELSSIRVPLQLWHGAQDRFVPFAHGQWLAARLPHAEKHLEPSEGHLSLMVNRAPPVHDWLLSHF
jgi:pimeloyl-ACP methyl ester carboxylesterase